ncbi:hypothetical protein CHLRE_08g361100v5 [Chlamydomonas reinhardtii]|uniref:Ubiquitin-like domain-containing protein n=1 Tax=Chlamydomonas reinhardtii TaxID=3055 RepID=A0A2K3DGJ0_CHLRE|nr:uncharacterized protein CHLRE_08g361100v5 [Chlamydomonas reinhardtii]PNW79639.1 hypothetical protein CHLRE_08g361100v5 [Chlamydomonas reinhardtii]
MAEPAAPTAPPAHDPAPAPTPPGAAAPPPSEAASAATAALLLRLLPAGGPTAAAAVASGSGRDERPATATAGGAAAGGAAAATAGAGAAGAAATAVPMRWSREELAELSGRSDPSCVPPPGADPTAYEVAFSKYNPTPGTGRTGFLAVPPNNYPFYTSEGEGPAGRGGEKYVPVLQPDGGQLSEWEPMYAPSKEQAEADRAAAYAAGVPHGYLAPGASRAAAGAAEGEEVLQLWVVSELHGDGEYGAQVDAAGSGRHRGGPFRVAVGARTRVEELRAVLRDAGGLLPALQRLSYAGKHLDDSQRTLQHYGIAYWHKRFPHWPIKIRKY